MVSFSTDPDMTGATNYNVIDTDYTSYTLVYGCDNTAVGKTESVWILGRETTMSDEKLEEVYAIMKEKLPDYDTNFW